MDFEVLPYHWNARAKLHEDYRYLQGLYEELLLDLTSQLNQIHDVDHSPRYWRMLIGPWLACFVQVLFDRWISIQQAIGRYELTGTVILTGHEDAFVPSDMPDFMRLFTSDEWNQHIYAVILQQFATVPCTKLARQGKGELPNKTVSAISWKYRTNRMLAALYARCTNFLGNERDAFFLTTYLTTWDEMRLYRRLGQVLRRWYSIPFVKVSTDNSQRQWVVKGETRSEFEVCARTLIPGQIPTAYLEGYGQLTAQVAGLPWPKQPKVIWTSGSYSSDDVFKAWAAEKVEQRGVPLVIGQHGGGYGTHLWAYYEEHQIAISDAYLSWGWTEAAQPKIKPVGELKAKRPLRVRHRNQAGILLVTRTFPRQSYHMFSAVVASQWLDYFNDQCAFVENLIAPIRDVLIVRLSSDDYGWDQVARWRDRFPELRLDEGLSNINDLIRRSRLYISTYNATTYLESFTMNIPTVIYWNPDHWELRDSAIPYFEELKSVGIFHETPVSAARHVALIWDDIDAWWTSPKVREVLERFKKRYCHLPDNLLERVEMALREVIGTSK